MAGNMGVIELLIAVLWIGLVVAIVTAFFRGMRALVDIPKRLERIERLLADRQGRNDSGGI